MPNRDDQATSWLHGRGASNQPPVFMLVVFYVKVARQLGSVAL
jgi:hypothetical protein